MPSQAARLADPLADLGRALADPGREHEAIEAAEHRGERAELAADPPDEQLDRLRARAGRRSPAASRMSLLIPDTPLSPQSW